MSTTKNITEERDDAILSGQEYVKSMFLGEIDLKKSVCLPGYFYIGDVDNDKEAYNLGMYAELEDEYRYDAERIAFAFKEVREKDPDAANICYLYEYVENKKGFFVKFETYSVRTKNSRPYIYTVTTFRRVFHKDGSFQDSKFRSPTFYNIDEWRKYHNNLWHQYDENDEVQPLYCGGHEIWNDEKFFSEVANY